MVSRRELLRLAVMASGALFAATGILAAVGYTRDRVRGEEQQIALASEVAVGGVHYFDYVDDQKAILLRLDEEQFVAYSGKCTHLSCAVYWHAERGELVCPCHEGVFDPRTGSVTAGPPPRPLERIVLRREGDAIIAVEQVPA
jgi:Rieske Fe-S protein